MPASNERLTSDLVSRANRAEGVSGAVLAGEEAPAAFEDCGEGGGRLLAREDGGRVFMRTYAPEGAARGVIVLTHGLGEHSGRYWHVCKRFNALGFRVSVWDLRGHGRSSGARGDAEGYRVLLDDLEAVCGMSREEGLPFYLFGHSMGGQITLRFLQERRPDCAGAVIASPWLRLAFEPPWWKLALARVAMGIFPRFVQGTGNTWSRLSRDFAHMASMPDLHLTHHKISARLYFAVRAGAEAALANAGAVETPLLLVHGDKDPVTSYRATEEFFNRAASRDKTLRFFPGVLHETHNDLDREMVLGEICDWLNRRLEIAKPE